MPSITDLFDQNKRVILIGAGLALIASAAGLALILSAAALAVSVQSLAKPKDDKSDGEAVVGLLSTVLTLAAIIVVAAAVMMIRARHRIRYRIAKAIHSPQKWQTQKYKHVEGMPKQQRQRLPA